LRLAFSRFSELGSATVLPAKLTYVAIHLAFLGVGLYKMNSMGLLPTAPSDWIVRYFPYHEVPHQEAQLSCNTKERA
jgi:hypothetical protein